MTILPGWTVGPSLDQKLNLVRGKYLLTINPIFTHASGIQGGRFIEIAVGMPSLDAATRNADPGSGAECAQWPFGVLKITESISLANLYTDSSKAGDVCVFPSSGKPVWFGSFFSAGATGSDYTITLSYDTTDVNSLPKKGSPELKRVFTEVAVMLRTLELKPPIVISKVSPTSAPPGATVTVYGRGFTLFNSDATVSFGGVTDDLNAIIAGDGTSLTFQVPTSIGSASCQEGRVSIGGDCLPVPPNHVDVNDCPRDSSGRSNLCGIPIPPGIYQIFITAGGVNEGPAMFTVTPPKPTSVSITLMYPVYLSFSGK
jgi:IPT/TIG domain